MPRFIPVASQLSQQSSPDLQNSPRQRQQLRQEPSQPQRQAADLQSQLPHQERPLPLQSAERVPLRSVPARTEASPSRQAVPLRSGYPAQPPRRPQKPQPRALTVPLKTEVRPSPLPYRQLSRPSRDPHLRQPGRWKGKLLSIFLHLTALGLLLLVLLFGLSLWMDRHYQGRVVDIDAAAAQQRDAVLVLGAGLNPDGTPSPMLAERLNTGISAYAKGAGRVLLLSGSFEVPAMEQAALAAGVPAEDIVLDPQGLNTSASIRRARDQFHYTSLVLVSQRYHLDRALDLAAQDGLDALAVPADTRHWPGQWRRDLREVLARAKDFFLVRLCF